MADQSLDSRRIAREQESRIAASAALGLNTVRPFVEFQSAMLRLGSETLELAAQNFEKGLAAYASVVDPQHSSTTQQQ